MFLIITFPNQSHLYFVHNSSKNKHLFIPFYFSHFSVYFHVSLFGISVVLKDLYLKVLHFINSLPCCLTQGPMDPPWLRASTFAPIKLTDYSSKRFWLWQFADRLIVCTDAFFFHFIDWIWKHSDSNLMCKGSGVLLLDWNEILGICWAVSSLSPSPRYAFSFQTLDLSFFTLLIPLCRRLRLDVTSPSSVRGLCSLCCFRKNFSPEEDLTLTINQCLGAVTSLGGKLLEALICKPCNRIISHPHWSI